MKINFTRIKSRLLPYGFLDCATSRGSMTLFRPDTLEGLFQKVHTDCQGKYGEAVYGNASISVTQHVHLKIDARLHLFNLDEDKERNWTIVENTEKARAWENRFIELAPKASESLAREIGPAMLHQTRHARCRSKYHLLKLRSSKTLYEQIEHFMLAYGDDFRREAERLAAWPGVMQVDASEECYLLACCAVLSGNEESTFFGQDPLDNNDLMWQIQLVVDGIFCLVKSHQIDKGTSC